MKQYASTDNIHLENQVAVILEGFVMIRNHCKSANDVHILAKYKEGDIIGFSPIDRGISTLPDSWSHCISEVEVAIINIEDFKELWSLQNEHLSSAMFQF